MLSVGIGFVISTFGLESVDDIEVDRLTFSGRKVTQFDGTDTDAFQGDDGMA